MNIALYGGSFDPPHIGHIAVVQKALQTLDIEKVIVMPAYRNPFKRSASAPADKRMAWLRAAFDDPRIEISDFEILQNRAVKTIESVFYLQKRYEKIYLIVGADNLASLPRWHEYEKLRTLVEFVIAARDTVAIPKEYLTLPVNVTISSSELRRKPRREYLPKSVADDIIHYYTTKEQSAKKS